MKATALQRERGCQLFVTPCLDTDPAPYRVRVAEDDETRRCCAGCAETLERDGALAFVFRPAMDLQTSAPPKAKGKR